MTQLLKIVIICAVASVALAIAFWGGKKTDQKTKQSKETSIGTDISAKGNVDVNNIRADTHPGEGVKIGSNITSEKDVRIQDIRVKSKGSNNG
jgi:ribosomal 50S subunit-recycling heat shock protein